MLQIKNITKIYKTDGFTQTALSDVNLNFRQSEFAAILGPSGSGKTTLLNIIGGLDKYTSGDLVINGTSTKKYKSADWDSYRNHRIGFVFQSYNLIYHQSVLNNVKLALTLSGISKKEAVMRATKALETVGLSKHIHKRPNQLSGGQMQRVAIARALVNNPEILLADEPTGALDSETSIQIMELLKEISKTKLVIMVTHNPDLAKEYASRIITLKDGQITGDSNPPTEQEIITPAAVPVAAAVAESPQKSKNKDRKTSKTSMSFLTALALSFNNLLTKKARTLLVAFAGSIGIIGIALIMAVSTGFQAYVDSIQEDTLRSYPLTIMQESTDIASTLLALRSGGGGKNGTETVKEQQFLTSILGNIKANDLKSFKKYYEDHKQSLSNSINNVKYSYSIDPLIYSVDATNTLSKLNPNNLFTSIYGSSMLSSYSSMASIYSQMIDKPDLIREQYDILKGRLPEKYDEMLLVLSEPNAISDLLVYSLGLRDTKELATLVSTVMSGKGVDINNTPKEFSYDELMAVDLRLIQPSDTYVYNQKYGVYEDMSGDKDFMQKLYDKATPLKIVGIVTAKEGVTSTALNPGVAYTSALVEHIIDYSYNSEAVKKQLSDTATDVFSGKKFDSEDNNYDIKFSDLVKMDEQKLKSMFGNNFDTSSIEKSSAKYIDNIQKSITADLTPARKDITQVYDLAAGELYAGLGDAFSVSQANAAVDKCLDGAAVSQQLTSLQKKYFVPQSVYKQALSGLLKGLAATYVAGYVKQDFSLTTDPQNPIAAKNDTLWQTVKSGYDTSAAILTATEKMAVAMTEASVKMQVLSKVQDMMSGVTSALSSAFKVNPEDIASAFSLNFSQDELMRVATAMAKKTDKNATQNLISLGYQDKDEPTYISYYFNSFDGKEAFLQFIDDYNKSVKAAGEDQKEIRYSDTTGILMDSVKTIVNAVSYVLIAFVSISLIVSSIMIGIITYISVYERTKEIGILRSIGASKRNISSIFNAETFIIGLLSGAFGIGITYSLIPVINAVLHHFAGNIPLNAALNIQDALILVVLSVILTLIGGLIPAKKASTKDPVEALRSE